MDNVILNIPLSLFLWLLGILLAIIGTVIGVVYANLKKKVDDVEESHEKFRDCTTSKFEGYNLELTVVKQKIISKNELMEAIDEAVDTAFTKWENKLFRDGRLSPRPKKEG